MKIKIKNFYIFFKLWIKTNQKIKKKIEVSRNLTIMYFGDLFRLQS